MKVVRTLVWLGVLYGIWYAGREALHNWRAGDARSAAVYTVAVLAMVTGLGMEAWRRASPRH